MAQLPCPGGNAGPTRSITRLAAARQRLKNGLRSPKTNPGSDAVCTQAADAGRRALAVAGDISASQGNSSSMALAPTTPAIPTERDLRLDLFRGLALWLIFLDHIPANIVNWVTIRNYGFSDAAEIFVFISGYTAAFVYGRTMQQRGMLVASARILKRAWTVYIAHLFIFVI